MKKLSIIVLSLWCALVSAAFAPLFTPPINLVSNDAPAPSPIQRPQMSRYINGQSSSFTSSYSYIGNRVELSNIARNTATPIAIAGSIDKLYISLESSSSPGDFTVTLRKNDVNTSLTCTVVASTSCSNNSDLVTVAAGDYVAWVVSPSSSPTSANFTFSSRFTATSNGESILGGGSASGFNSTARFVGFDGATNSPMPTDYASGSQVMPTSGTIDKLYIKISDPATNGDTITATLYKNGSPTSLTCNAVASVYPVVCNDTTNSVSVSAEDTVSMEFVSDNSGTTRTSTFSVRWRPTVSPEIPMFATTSSIDTGATSYSPLQTGRFSSTTELSNGIAIGATVKSLYAKLVTSPGTSKGYTFKGRKNGVNQTITCAITGSATTCKDTSNSFSVSAHDNVGWSAEIVGSSPTSSAVSVSTIVTVP